MRSDLSKIGRTYVVPTRYREVVPTVSNSESGLLRQSYETQTRERLRASTNQLAWRKV